MNLFFLKARLRGQLQKTSSFETELTQIPLRAKRYHDVENSAEYKEFLDLDSKVNDPAFKSKKVEIIKTKYKDTPEYKLLMQVKQLSKSPLVKAYIAEGKEEEASEVQKYIELKKQTESNEFKQKCAFWQDAHRWENSTEGKMEARYAALKKNEDILFYQNTDKKIIEHWEQFELVFEDNFDGKALKESAWKPGFIYPNEHFKNVHSYSNEKQAYNNGNNVEMHDSVLTIRTKKEAKEAPAWDEKKGMYMKQFTYTSDALYTDKVAVETGCVIQVKCRCSGRLNHGIYLRSMNHVPFISLFDYTGSKMYCGVKDSIAHDKNLKNLGNLIAGSDTIFTASWQKDEIVWFVNNMEVYRTKNIVPDKEKLYIHLYSFLFENDRRSSEGELNVDWVKVYKLKK